jgi:hypothetical protein
MKACGELEVELHSFLTSILDGGGVMFHTPATLSFGKEVQVCIEQWALWVPEPAWMFWGREKSVATDRN